MRNEPRTVDAAVSVRVPPSSIHNEASLSTDPTSISVPMRTVTPETAITASSPAPGTMPSDQLAGSVQSPSPPEIQDMEVPVGTGLSGAGGGFAARLPSTSSSACSE